MNDNSKWTHGVNSQRAQTRNWTWQRFLICHANKDPGSKTETEFSTKEDTD